MNIFNYDTLYKVTVFYLKILKYPGKIILLSQDNDFSKELGGGGGRSRMDIAKVCEDILRLTIANAINK